MKQESDTGRPLPLEEASLNEVTGGLEPQPMPSAGARGIPGMEEFVEGLNQAGEPQINTGNPEILPLSLENPAGNP